MRLANILFLVALTLSIPLTASAAGATVSLAPMPLQLSVDQVAPLAVKVASVDGLYGFDVLLKFDPALIQIEDADPNTPGIQWLPGDFLAYDFVVKNEADNSAGTAQFVMTQMNPSEARSGAGTLASLYVRGKAPGKTTVEITSVTLANRNGERVPAAASNAEVRVATSSAAPLESPTPLPTAPAPKLELTPSANQGVAPTATPKVPLSGAATATEPVIPPSPAPAGPAPSPTSPAATVSAPTGPVLTAPPPVSEAAGQPTPGGAAAEVGPDATRAMPPTSPAPAATAGAAPASVAPAATGVLEPLPSAPTRVASVTQPARDNTLLFAGGGMLLAAAVGAIFVLVRRGR